MNNRDAIIEKIKKLLRMKRGGSQGEIENALAMAAELARKHGIDLAGIDPDAEEQRIYHTTDVLKSRLPLEAKYAAAVLVNFFNVQVVVSRRANPQRPWQPQWIVHLVGTTWDQQVARYVFAFLQTHFRRAWATRANRRLKNRNSFLDGMFLGVCSVLEEERRVQASEAGLVLIGRAVQQRKDYVSKHWPDAKDKDIGNDDSNADEARRAGARAGLETKIRKAVDGARTPERPALPPAAGQLALL